MKRARPTIRAKISSLFALSTLMGMAAWSALILFLPPTFFSRVVGVGGLMVFGVSQIWLAMLVERLAMNSGRRS